MPTTYEIKFISENIETLTVPTENDSTINYFDAILDKLIEKSLINFGDRYKGGQRPNLPRNLKELVEIAKIKSIKESTDIHGKVTERYVYPI